MANSPANLRGIKCYNVSIGLLDGNNAQGQKVYCFLKVSSKVLPSLVA